MKDDGSGIVTNVEMKTTPGEYLFSSNISKINLDRKTLIMVETLHMSGNPGFVIGTNTKQCSLIEVEDNKIWPLLKRLIKSLGNLSITPSSTPPSPNKESYS